MSVKTMSNFEYNRDNCLVAIDLSNEVSSLASLMKSSMSIARRVVSRSSVSRNNLETFLGSTMANS